MSLFCFVKIFLLWFTESVKYSFAFKNSSYALLGAQLSWLPARVGAYISMHCGISQAQRERSANDAGLYEHAHITPNGHMLILPLTSSIQY